MLINSYPFQKFSFKYRLFSATQSFGSQDYYRKSLMTILGLAGVLFCENEQAKTKWIIVCSEEILGCLGKLGEFSEQQQVIE